MDATITNLEYTLKDKDVQSQDALVPMIQEVVRLLRQTVTEKRRRWAEEEKEMGDCPCGCSVPLSATGSLPLTASTVSSP
jgi:hypothetical protein